MRIALTRPVNEAIAHCELTHLARERIDVRKARAEHAAYEAALESLGCRIVHLPDAPDLPDAVFVEDTAVVLDEIAVITHPGAPSRRPEITSTADVLARYRPLCWIQAPATLDGGDVLVLDRTIWVGLSTRTNPEGVEQLNRLVEPLGYEVRGVDVGGCLHLKSAVTCVAERTVLLNPAWLDTNPFRALDRIEIDPAEPFAGNALCIGDAVLYPSMYPRTRDRLERAGLDVRTVDTMEISKAEGGVTCCSIVFDL